MKKLIFVYNADSGLIDKVKDGIHKATSPETYECNLCAITYGNVFMKKEWKDFIDGLPIDSEFMYRDTFPTKYSGVETTYPCVHVDTDGEFSVLITADELNNQDSLERLQLLVTDSLKKM